MEPKLFLFSLFLCSHVVTSTSQSGEPFSLFSLCAYVCVNTNIIVNSFCGSIHVAGLAEVGILLLIYWHFLWCKHRRNSSDTCTAVLWLLMPQKPLKIKFQGNCHIGKNLIISASVSCFEYFLKQIMKQIQGPVCARTLSNSPLISKTLCNQFLTRNQC